MSTSGSQEVQEVKKKSNFYSNEKTSNGTQKIPGVTTRAFFKLWICDVHLMIPSPIRRCAYVFRGKQVEHLIIFGTITRVEHLTTRMLYEVDDGTGSINCLYDHSRMLNEKAHYIINEVAVSLNSRHANEEPNIKLDNKDYSTSGRHEKDIAAAKKTCVDWLRKKVVNYARKNTESFSIGDTICAKGRINEYRNRRELFVYQLHLINNLKDEADHILELVNLYENEYKNYIT